MHQVAKEEPTIEQVQSLVTWSALESARYDWRRRLGRGDLRDGALQVEAPGAEQDTTHWFDPVRSCVQAAWGALVDV